MPLLRRLRMPSVSRLRCSYGALRLPIPFGLDSGYPLSSAYQVASAPFFAGLSPGHVPPALARLDVCEDWSPAPRCTGFSLGEMRVSQVPGSSSSCVPRPRTPPAPRSSAHLLERGCCLPGGKAFGHRHLGNFEAGSPRPTRSRTYASPTSFSSPSQGSLPTWWAPWSRGFRTLWMTHRIS